MAAAAAMTPEQQRAAEREADACLEVLLADGLFNEFDFTDWILLSPEASTLKGEEFTEKVFPLLAKYFQGTELTTLTTGYRWLADLNLPSKRHLSARAFQADPPQNLIVLAVFLKLQVLKIYGAGLKRDQPFWDVCLEMMKIVEARRSSLTVEYCERVHTPLPEPVRTFHTNREADINNIMSEDFGEKWENFKRNKTVRPPANHPSASPNDMDWFRLVRRLSETKRAELWTQAMSLVLENAVNLQAYAPEPAVSLWNGWTMIKTQVIASTPRDVVPEHLMHLWSMVTDHSHHYLSWLKFSEQFFLFCLAAGCPKASRTDPFKSLEALRDHVSRQLAYTADLHDRIHKLNTQITLQQRMITALAYRDVIENLSITSNGNNSTEKWTNFVNTIFLQPGTTTNTISADHPFHALYARELPKRNGIPLFKEMAIKLFGELSRTIHYFQPSSDFGQYTPMPGQFDPMQIDFLTAIRPLEANLGDETNLRWESERARYLGGGSAATAATAAAAASSGISGPLPPPTTSAPRQTGRKKKKKKNVSIT